MALSDRLDPTPGDVCALPPGPIDTVGALQEHLQRAIELEHALVPPYLCALYSLDRDVNPAAASVVAGVAVDEMFHMAAVANLLNAVGGRPAFDVPDMLPGYPRPLPHVDESFIVSLLPFGPVALETFLVAEHPGAPDAPESTRCVDSIGHFYNRIDRALVQLCDELGEAALFTGDPRHQVVSGPLAPIVDLRGARDALAVIVEQGEGRSHAEVWDRGADRTPSVEIGHYYRFLELREGRRFEPDDTLASGPTGERITIRAEAVRNMQPNPRIDEQAIGSSIREAQEDFNQEYCALLQVLEQTFNGDPAQLGESIRSMHGLREHAVALLQMEIPGTSFVAGPTFEYVQPADRW